MIQKIILSAGLSAGFINPFLSSSTFNQNTKKNLEFKNSQKQNYEFIFSNSKHFKEGKLVPGEKDYSDEFRSAYHKFKTMVKRSGYEKILIPNIQGYLMYDNNSPINLSPESIAKMQKILTSDSLKLNFVYVSIKKNLVNNINFFTYAINYSVVVNEETIEDNLSVYKADELFSENIFFSPYNLNITFTDFNYNQINWTAWAEKEPERLLEKNITIDQVNIKIKIDFERKAIWRFNSLTSFPKDRDFMIMGMFDNDSRIKDTIENKLVWHKKPSDSELRIRKLYLETSYPTWRFNVVAEIQKGTEKTPSNNLLDFSVDVKIKVKDSDEIMVTECRFIIEILT